MDVESMTELCFQIITCVGSAKSSFIEAIVSAKSGDFDGARAKIKEGDNYFAEGHHVHADLVSKEANGEQTLITLLLIHAEDQLMSAETARIYALEFIELYEKLQEKGVI